MIGVDRGMHHSALSAIVFPEPLLHVARVRHVGVNPVRRSHIPRTDVVEQRPGRRPR